MIFRFKKLSRDVSRLIALFGRLLIYRELLASIGMPRPALLATPREHTMHPCFSPAPIRRHQRQVEWHLARQSLRSKVDQLVCWVRENDQDVSSESRRSASLFAGFVPWPFWILGQFICICYYANLSLPPRHLDASLPLLKSGRPFLKVNPIVMQPLGSTRKDTPTDNMLQGLPTKLLLSIFEEFLPDPDWHLKRGILWVRSLKISFNVSVRHTSLSPVFAEHLGDCAL